MLSLKIWVMLYFLDYFEDVLVDYDGLNLILAWLMLNVILSVITYMPRSHAKVTFGLYKSNNNAQQVLDGFV